MELGSEIARKKVITVFLFPTNSPFALLTYIHILFLYYIEPKFLRQKLDNKNEHGSARWSSKSEIKKHFRKEKLTNISKVGFPICFDRRLKYVWFDDETPHWCYLGSSGSGKSTLLHLIGGVDKPTSGKVFIEGKDVYSLNEENLAIFRRRQVGLIYQFYNLIPILNVEENITLPLELDGRVVNKNHLENLLDSLNIKERRKHLPNELSGGQQQRTSIGRALITKPAILLADEPTGNLDSKASDEIVDILKMSNKKYNQTIIMITHNLDIAAVADRIIKIEDGHIVKEG